MKLIDEVIELLGSKDGNLTYALIKTNNKGSIKGGSTLKLSLMMLPPLCE